MCPRLFLEGQPACGQCRSALSFPCSDYPRGKTPGRWALPRHSLLVGGWVCLNLVLGFGSQLCADNVSPFSKVSFVNSEDDLLVPICPASLTYFSKTQNLNRE